MKSNPNSSKCQKCYERVKETGTLLFCEATGVCKYEYKEE